MRDRVRLLLAIALLATVVRPAGPAHAATIAVTTTEDELATNGRCSLREAVRNANADADLHPDCPRGTGQDRIVLAPGTYTLALGGRGEDAAQAGDLDLTDPDGVTIEGADALTTIVQAGASPGAGIDRAFHLRGGARVTLVGLTVRHGRVTGAGEGGGGIYVEEDATLDARRTVIRDNRSVELNGGGMRIDGNGQVTLTDVLVAGNESRSLGGGVHVNAQTSALTAINATFSENRAADPATGLGGAIRNAGTATLLNVTLSGNTAGASGGAISQGNNPLTLSHVTIARNSAPVGGGISATATGQVTLRATLLAANGGGNCDLAAGLAVLAGSNLSSNGTCAAVLTGPGDQNNVDPRLGDPRDNGGFAPTLAPEPTSPAVDAVLDGCPPPATDQRGAPRPLDGNGDGTARCDVGAVELQRADLGLTKTAAPPDPVVGSRTTFTLTATNAGPTASIARVVDALPEGVDFESATPSQGACVLRGRTVTCELGALAPGGTATVAVVVTARTVGALANAAAVGGSDADPNPGNNAASAPIVVRPGNGSPTPTATPTPTGSPAPNGSPTPAPNGSPTPVPDAKRDKDDDDKRRKLTEDERRQRQRTNRSGADDERTEGNVLAVKADARPPYVVIGTRDGLQRVVLLCKDDCPRVRVGDYLVAEGEKVHEGLFEATDVSVERR